MATVIINKPEQLAGSLRMLLGKTFIPAEHADILYVPSSFSIQSLARIPFYICLVMSLLTGTLWLYTLLTEVIKWSRQSEFRNEGVIITFTIFAFMSLLLILSAWYWRKSKRLQQQIDSGEVRYGLWITPSHLLVRDLNEGLKCVEKKEIASLEVYRSGRPPIDMVICHLHNQQVVRIVADWLAGYYKKVEALKELIEKKLLPEKLRPDEIDHFLNSYSTPDPRPNRFFQLARFVEDYDQENKLNVTEKSALINYVNRYIESWSATERVAEPEWWLEIETVDNWEYGVNGVTHNLEFKGFAKSPHWLMPLARYAVLEFEHPALLAQQYVDQFIEAGSYSSLEGLKLMVPVSADCIQRIMDSGKFSHLRVLHTPNIVSDGELRQRFAAWKAEHKIKSV